MPLVILDTAKAHWSDMFTQVMDGTATSQQLEKSALIVALMTGYPPTNRCSRIHDGRWQRTGEPVATVSGLF